MKYFLHSLIILTFLFLPKLAFSGFSGDKVIYNLENEKVESASLWQDSIGLVLTVLLTKEEGKNFAILTRNNINKILNVHYKGKVLLSATIQTEITSSRIALRNFKDRSEAEKIMIELIRK